MDDIKLYGTHDDELASLVTVVSVFAEDICGLNKCNFVSLHRDKLGEVIWQLSPDSVYCYLGIFEADNFKMRMIKQKLTADYKDLRNFEITFVRPEYCAGSQFLCSICDETCWRNYLVDQGRIAFC